MMTTLFGLLRSMYSSFQFLKVNTKVPSITIANSAISYYDNECIEVNAKFIKQYIQNLESSEVTTETESPILIDVSTQCSPSDFSNINSESISTKKQL